MTKEIFSLDWPHGYVDSQGRPARIISTDAQGIFPIVCLIKSAENQEFVYRCYSNGTDTCGDQIIRNAPAPKKTFEIWLNCYTDDDSSKVRTYGHLTKEEADRGCNPWRAACVKLTFTEGDGL